jgi:dihydrodipicolinate synthase/N-acetylneuraminate lyase
MDKKLSAFVMTMTQFDQNGAVDETAFRAHLRRLRDAGVGVYVAGSASGEGFSLTPDEVDRVLAISIEELKGHVSVRAMGCEVRHAEETKDFLRRIAHHPVDAVHIFPPEMGHATKPTEAELLAYYTDVIATTRLPVILSCYQTLGFDVPPSLIDSLLHRFQRQIVGFFYGGHDVRYLSRMIEAFADKIEVHCAGPAHALTTLSLGGHGFMGHEGNLAPKLAHSVITAFEQGDHATLRSSFSRLMAISRIHYRHGGPVRAMKPLLDALGLQGGTVRLPRMAIGSKALEGVLRDTLALNIPELQGLPKR